MPWLTSNSRRQISSTRAFRLRLPAALRLLKRRRMHGSSGRTPTHSRLRQTSCACARSIWRTPAPTSRWEQPTQQTCGRPWPICCSISELPLEEDVMPSFYFEQLLQNGLNGIDQQGITAAVLQIAGVILILSLLWAVYEAYASGGDVRYLGVAAIRYLVLGLVFLNYPSAFRTVNGMFNGVADGIYKLSGGVDVIKAWGNSLSEAWQTNPNWFSSLWNLVAGGISAIVAGLITLIGYLILPFTYTLFTLFYALYGSILYVVGPFVLALIPSRGLGQLGRAYFVNMMIFQCWGLLYAILQALMTALQITSPMQFNGAWLDAFIGSSQMIVMSVASVLLAIMVALIPFIASRIVRGDIGS